GTGIRGVLYHCIPDADHFSGADSWALRYAPRFDASICTGNAGPWIAGIAEGRHPRGREPAGDGNGPAIYFSFRICVPHRFDAAVFLVHRPSHSHDMAH